MIGVLEMVACNQCKKKACAKRLIDEQGLCNDCSKKISCNEILAELNLNTEGTVGNLSTIDFLRCIQTVVQTSYDTLNKRLVEIEDKLTRANEERMECRKKCVDLEQNVLKLRTDVDKLTEQVNDQSKILCAQQKFLEEVDRDKRQKDLIVLGFVERVNTDEKEEFMKILDRIGVPRNTIIVTNMMRLGKINEQYEENKRPLKITLKKSAMRDEILKNAWKLKDEGENSPYKKIYLKRDIHPEIRKEEKRLYNVFKAEKEKPVNADFEVVFDRKKRVVLCNGTEIDHFRLFTSFL